MSKDKAKMASPATLLSAPAVARRVLALLTDESQNEWARLRLLEWVDQLTNAHGCGSGWSPKNYDLMLPAFRRAAAATERMRPKAKAYAPTVTAYGVILGALERARAGETLAAVFAELESRREEALAASLRRRAEAIVKDAARYDADTRRAVELSIQRGDAENLAVTVERAEAGETVCDLTDPELDAEIERTEAGLAELISRILGHPCLPVYLYQQIAEALAEVFNALGGERQRRVGDSAAYIGMVLREHAAKECEGGSAR